MNVILWIILGALVGWVTTLIMGIKEGMIFYIIVGIVGAIVGGWIMNFFGYGGISGFNLYSFLVALLGAIVLVILFRAIR